MSRSILVLSSILGVTLAGPGTSWSAPKSEPKEVPCAQLAEERRKVVEAARALPAVKALKKEPSPRLGWAEEPFLSRCETQKPSQRIGWAVRSLQWIPAFAYNRVLIDKKSRGAERFCAAIAAHQSVVDSSFLMERYATYTITPAQCVRSFRKLPRPLAECLGGTSRTPEKCASLFTRGKFARAYLQFDAALRSRKAKR